MPAPVDIVPLGLECDNYNPTSSEHIYYYEYPYKITLRNHIDPNDSKLERRRDKVMRRLMLEEFIDRELVYSCRFYISESYQRVYLRHYVDVKTFIQFFHTEIEQIHGPKNQAHVDLLTSDDLFCSVREPFYGKFDIKVYITAALVKSGLFFNHNQSLSERRQMQTDVKEFLAENLPQSDQHWRGDLYTKMDLLVDLLPFIKLQYPDARLIITKCIPK